MNDTIVRIRRITNGFVICARDPKIAKSNQDSPRKPWKDPECEYSFTTFEKVLKWLKDNVDNLVPEPDSATEYSNSFDQATASER